MKTLTVKEVAQTLGITTRAVIQRLSKGQLKGTRKTNQYGIQEWLVYPNKEITQLSQSNNKQIEINNAEEVLFEVQEQSKNWRESELSKLEVISEKLIEPLINKLESQTKLLLEQEKLIEDQKRQLRLLPDLEKRAEDERKISELKMLETIALEKQIQEIENLRIEEQKRLFEKESKEQELQQELTALKNQLQQPWWKKLFK